MHLLPAFTAAEERTAFLQYEEAPTLTLRNHLVERNLRLVKMRALHFSKAGVISLSDCGVKRDRCSDHFHQLLNARDLLATCLGQFLQGWCSAK